jgi:hypothetical protein
MGFFMNPYYYKKYSFYIEFAHTCIKNLSLNGVLNKWKIIAQNWWNVFILLLNPSRIVESVCNQPQIIYKGKITRQRGFSYFVNLWQTMNNVLYLKMYLCLCKLCPVLALKIVRT